jgi:hypothetical protein
VVSLWKIASAALARSSNHASLSPGIFERAAKG